MLFVALTLSALLLQCAPNVGSRTMGAIISVESGGDPYAIHDNTSGRSYFLASAGEAIRTADALLLQHHNLDLGISQINSSNLPGIGLSVPAAFDACSNIHAGAQILQGDYRTAVGRFGPGQFALQRALGAYNTGSIYAGDEYIAKILAAAGVVSKVQSATISHAHAAPVQPVSRRPAHPSQKRIDPNDAPMMISTVQKPMI